MQLGTLTVIRAVADDMYAEHLKYFCDRILPLLSMGFTGMLVHGILPNAMISVILVPIIKDKTGKINSKDNYRVIALVSIMSKIKKKSYSIEWMSFCQPITISLDLKRSMAQTCAYMC